MSSLLILARHSLPEIEKDRPAHEWKLSDEGRSRAERLADDLARYRPAGLFSSPEPKALETAQILSKRLDVPVSVVDGLHEHVRSQVPFLSRMEFETAVREFFERPDAPVFGSETADAAHERFSKSVLSILAGNEDGTAMIVSHGTVMALFVSRLTGQPAFPLWSALGIPGFMILDMQTRDLIGIENIL